MSLFLTTSHLFIVDIVDIINIRFCHSLPDGVGFVFPFEGNERHLVSVS